jgi:hypothetical protein
VFLEGFPGGTRGRRPIRKLILLSSLSVFYRMPAKETRGTTDGGLGV